MAFLVVTMTAVPRSLRGHLTAWLTELSPGTFVGDVPPQVRALLWDKLTRLRASGAVACAYADGSELGLRIESRDDRWSVVDLDGVNLCMRHPDNDGTRRAHARQQLGESEP